MAPNRPRIVHLITRLDLGGAQQNTLYCVEHHDRERFSVGLWAGAGGRLDAQARGIPDADVRLVPWLRHPVAPAHDAWAFFRLVAQLRGVDILHTHSSKAGILGRLAARFARVPAVVHTVHGWSFNRTQSRATRWGYRTLERLAARSTDLLICVSEADRARGQALGIGDPARYRILRSGIDPSLYAPRPGARERVRSELGIGPDEILVTTIGNLKAQKGPLHFLAAARRARDADRRLRFAVAGDGPLRAEVERAIDDFALGDAVRLLGWRDDVPGLLAASDIFLLTSLFEGLPRAALQAIAAGVPVVLTDTGGTAEIVRSGETGFLVPVGDPAAAADAVVRLASDPELARGFAARAGTRLGSEFDIRKMVTDLEALYDGILAGRGPRRATRLAFAMPRTKLEADD